jgi:hypothetical protein
MKRFFLLLISVVIANSGFGQTKMIINKTSGTDSPLTLIASEEWKTITDNNTADLGQLIFNKYSDGSITVSGNWNRGSTEGVISSGTGIIINTAFSIAEQGTAFNSAAPVGYQNSPFTDSISGSANDGKSSGTYTIAFSTYGWPQILQGVFTATRISGSGITVSVKEITGTVVPEAFALFQNYPNPFNPTTTISFSLPSRSFVSLKIFDLLGKEVTTIVSGEMQEGSYSRTWNAANISSGIYFYRLQAGTFTETKKLILLR